MQTFAAYMQDALYGPKGYYSSGIAKSGRKGDYITAPDVGSIFGRLLGVIFKDWRTRLDSDSFRLVEVGAGEGALAQGLRMEAQDIPYVAVEKSPTRQGVLITAIPAASATFDVLPDLAVLKRSPVEGVLFANELIDAFPVHRVRVQNGRLEEAHVEVPGKDQRFPTLRWTTPSTPDLQAYLDRLGVVLPEGYETEINLAMGDWMKEAAMALQKGLMVLIDYGRPAHDYYAPERDRGTLRVFYKQRVYQAAEWMGQGVEEGPVDWTSDVDFTSLALYAREAGFVPLAFMEMGTFLMMGVREDLVPTRGSQTGLRYLLHPEGMGAAFHVLILGKGIEPESWTFKHNRIKRLGLEMNQ